MARKNARLGAHLQVQAIRRTHAEEREDLRNATAELRRWREGL